MDLTLSDEQRLLRESAERFVGETYNAEHRRKLANDPLGFSAEIWKQLSFDDPAAISLLDAQSFCAQAKGRRAV